MNLDRKVLERIERENIRIRPRWFFGVKEGLVWLWATVLEMGAALSLGMALLFAFQRKSYLAGLLLAGVFAWLFFWGFRRFFEAGFFKFYKLGFTAVFSALFVVNGALAFAFWESGKAEEVRLQIEEAPAYQELEPALEKVFGPSDESEKNMQDQAQRADDGENQKKEGADVKEADERDEEGDDQEDEDENEESDHGGVTERRRSDSASDDSEEEDDSGDDRESRRTERKNEGEDGADDREGAGLQVQGAETEKRGDDGEAERESERDGERERESGREGEDETDNPEERSDSEEDSD